MRIGTESQTKSVGAPSTPPAPPSQGGEKTKSRGLFPPSQGGKETRRRLLSPPCEGEVGGVRAAVVTGASSGIGRALARELACRGYRVGLVARRRKALEDLVGEIETHGGRAHAAAADVGDRQALHAAIQQIEGALGPVDVIVANAGFGTPTRLAPLNVADVEDTFRVNVLGVVYSIEAVLRACSTGDGDSSWRSPAWPHSRGCRESPPTAPARRP